MLRPFCLILALALASQPAIAEDKPRVVAVNYALQLLAERLLGDEVDVVYPVPEGTDPSFWRPSISDISAVQSADLILLNGAGFATWTAKVSLPKSKLVDTSRAVKDRFIATETITHSHGDGGEHSHEGIAAYTWLEPEMALAQAEAIAAAAAGRDLVDPEVVFARLAELKAELGTVSAAAVDALEPAKGVPMIATHPRYQYLARAFGLTVTSLEWEAGEVPTDGQLSELGQLVAETGAKVLIWEAEPPQEARAAVAGLGLQDVVVPPLAVPTGASGFVAAYQSAVDAIVDAVARVGDG